SMKDRAQKPLIRAIVNRPFLLTLTVCVGLFTLAYTGDQPTEGGSRAILQTAFGLFALMVFAIGVQILAHRSLMLALGAAIVWVVSAGVLAAPLVAATDDPVMACLIAAVGIMLMGCGAVFCRRIGLATLLAPGLFILAGFATAGLGIVGPFVHALGATTVMIISILLAHSVDQAHLQGYRPAPAAGEALNQTASYGFFALLFAMGVGLAFLVVKQGDLLSSLAPGAFDPWRFFVSIGLFSLPALLLLPGLLWLSHGFDQQIHGGQVGRFDALIPAAWARFRTFYAIQTSYGILAIAVVLLISSLFLTPLSAIGPILVGGLFLSIVVGVAFFSLRAFIMAASLLVLGGGLGTAIDSFIFTPVLPVPDRLASLYFAALVLAIPAQHFMQVSSDSKYRRTVLATVIQRTAGPALLAAGLVLSILSLVSITSLWPQAVLVARWLSVIFALSFFMGPAVMVVLSSRYGKY
ncbi:MAG: hypothetical protein AAFR20_11200, partial [Pseudomonadota bacterium]